MTNLRFGNGVGFSEGVGRYETFNVDIGLVVEKEGFYSSPMHETLATSLFLVVEVKNEIEEVNIYKQNAYRCTYKKRQTTGP